MLFFNWASRKRKRKSKRASACKANKSIQSCRVRWGSQRLAARRAPGGGKRSEVQRTCKCSDLCQADRTPADPMAAVMHLRHLLHATQSKRGREGGGKREANRAVVAGNGVSDAHSLASCSDPQPKRQTDTQARLLGLREGKGKTKAERIAGNRIAFLSFITRNGKQRNYHLTHSSGNGKGVWRGGRAVKGAANLSIKKRTKVFRCCCCCCVARWQNCKMATSRCRRRVWSETRAETNWGSWRAIKQGGERGRQAAKQQANGAFGKNTRKTLQNALWEMCENFQLQLELQRGGRSREGVAWRAGATFWQPAAVCVA